MAVSRNSIGLYVVEWLDDFPEWLEWTAWRRLGLGLYRQAQSLTVCMAEPPATSDAVRLELDWHTQASKELTQERGWRYGAPIMPTYADPWLPWPGDMCRSLRIAEEQRRNVQGRNFEHAPKYLVHKGPAACQRAILEQARPTHTSDRFRAAAE